MTQSQWVLHLYRKIVKKNSTLAGMSIPKSKHRLNVIWMILVANIQTRHH